MKFSEQNANVIKALFEARKLFTKVKKDKQNAHLKNRYATLDSVLDAIMPGLTEKGLFLTQDQSVSEDLKSMTVFTRFIHVESNEWVEYSFTLPMQKLDPQGGGSTNSYARRYALCTALGLATADDDAQLAVKSASDWKKELDACETIEELAKVYNTAYKMSNAANRRIIEDHKNMLKAKLSVGNARGFNPAEPSANVAKNEKVENEPQQEVKSQPITDFE
ncbi:ERF family protein [Salmonella enterica subsp. arizonae]|nr:ERF family protein [Salmonella enterica subsp. arizonae]